MEFSPSEIFIPHSSEQPAASRGGRTLGSSGGVWALGLREGCHQKANNDPLSHKIYLFSPFWEGEERWKKKKKQDEKSGCSFWQYICAATGL